MKAKRIMGISMAVIVSAMATQAAIIIKDDFGNMGGAGDSITNSVLEVGSGTWAGSLLSNGGNIMRAPANPGTQEGASIALPAFNAGDIITIKARAARTDTTTSWFGIGFSDSSSTANLSANTPWATFYATTGGANVFGGSSTANSTGISFRPSGAVGTAATLMEFTYDTRAGTVTAIYGGETIHDAVAITTTGTPTLDHAFFVMRTPEGGGPPGSYLVDFEVSVTEAATPAFDKIADPPNLIANGDFSQSTPVSGTGWNNQWRVEGSKGQFPFFDGSYAAVTGWTHYNEDPHNLFSYTDPGDILDDTDKLSTLINAGNESIVLNSSYDYRNGMMQTNILNGAAVHSDATYEFSVDVWQNTLKDHSLTTFTAALTTGADATNLVDTVAGSLLQISPTTTLPTAGGILYTTQVSGSSLLTGQVNVMFESLNTVAISGWPTTSVDPGDPNEVSQLFVGSVSLTVVIPAGDVTKDGVLDQNDIDLSQLYLEGDGGDPATTRQDLLIAGGSTSAQALVSLNLSDFDINGDDYFDVADVGALEEMIYGAEEIMLEIAGNGSGLDFGWNSRSSSRYNLESSTSLVIPNWAAYNDGATLYTNISGSVTKTNTLIGVQTDGSTRFFRVVK